MKRAFISCKLVLGLSLAFGLFLPGLDSGGAEAKPSASISSRKLLPGQVARENIERVNQQIDWHTSLGAAQNQARREGKMILWVQMIGQMDGAT